MTEQTPLAHAGARAEATVAAAAVGALVVLALRIVRGTAVDACPSPASATGAVLASSTAGGSSPRPDPALATSPAVPLARAPGGPLRRVAGECSRAARRRQVEPQRAVSPALPPTDGRVGLAIPRE